MRPKGTPSPPENRAELAIFVKFGRNFWVCRLGAPHPKIFGALKVMTLAYFHAKYLGLTIKTHWDTLNQSLVLFYPIFLVWQKSLISLSLRKALGTSNFRPFFSKIIPFFLLEGSRPNHSKKQEGMDPYYLALKYFGVGCTPKAHIAPSLWVPRKNHLKCG